MGDLMTQPQGSSPYEPQSEPSQGSAPQQPSFGQPSYGSPEQPSTYGASSPQPPSYDQSAYGAPQQPYGQPQQPYGAAQPYQQPYAYAPAEHPQAQTVFILGIVGIFVGIIPFIAWYLGAQAKKEIEAGAPYPFEGKLKTGYLLGKVFSIIYLVIIALYIVGIIALIGFGAMQS